MGTLLLPVAFLSAARDTCIMHTTAFLVHTLQTKEASSDSKVESWNIENFVDAVKNAAPQLSWAAVIEALDLADLRVHGPEDLQTIARAYARATNHVCVGVSAAQPHVRVCIAHNACVYISAAQGFPQRIGMHTRTTCSHAHPLDHPATPTHVSWQPHLHAHVYQRARIHTHLCMYALPTYAHRARSP